MPGTIRRMAGWFGQVIGTEDWDNAFDGVENTIERLVLAGIGARPTITSPPAITNIGTDTLNVGPWRGVGFEGDFPYPVFQTGSAVGVNFGTATHGSVLGDVDVTTDGEFRMVILLARYATIDNEEVVDDNSATDYRLLEHAVSYRVIMGTQQASQSAALLPPDLEDEIANGSIPLLGILRTRSGGVQGNTIKALAYAHKGRSAADEARLKAYLTEGTLVRFPDDPNVDEPEHALTANELSFVANPTDYEPRLIAGNRWAAMVDGELITSDMVTPGFDYLEGDTQLPTSGTRYVVLDWERQPYGVLRPRILLYSDTASIFRGVILATAVTAGGAPTVTFWERPPVENQLAHVEASADQAANASTSWATLTDAFDTAVFVRDENVSHSSPDADLDLTAGTWRLRASLGLTGDAAAPDVSFRWAAGAYTSTPRVLASFSNTDESHLVIEAIVDLPAATNVVLQVLASAGTPTITVLAGSTITAERVA